MSGYRNRKASTSSVSQLPAALTPAVFVLTWEKLRLWRHSKIFLGRMLVEKGVSEGILDFLIYLFTSIFIKTLTV